LTSELDTYTFKEGDKILEGDIEKGKTYSKEELDKGVIVVEDREKLRVKQFLDNIDENEKSLVFCRNQRHALQIRDLINQLSPSKNPNYCHRVTADDTSVGELHLRNFQDNTKTIPTILTTSHKLSTGVDAPEIRNIVLFRPIKSMIEFKQIIGRGTRLFENKDYFTVYDYVDAHNHFQDPEWDGESEGGYPGGTSPKLCKECNQKPCICETGENPCEMCGYAPCVCEKPTSETARIKLPDGSTRDVKTNIQTSFWSPEGRPISASEFLKLLFGELPKFFMNEEEWREVWSKPDTRKKLLNELEEAGYGTESFYQLQSMINAQKCDLYDVLAFIAFNKDLVDRKTRASKAKLYLDSYDPRQQEFLDFVLEQYVEEGVLELDDQKLPNLLTLKYLSTNNGVQKLGGDLKSIRENFIDFQKHLYESLVA
jgi:type I restriction enzyme R subunit